MSQVNIYLVGGAVRNRLLQLPVTERDWVVVGATPKDMLSLGYKRVGRDFPVFLHPKTKEEYALARTEQKMAEGHTGFICYASPKVTLEEDLRRRDLTINAMACDEQGRLIDPYQGQKDLHSRVLRHVSDAFVEDPLRVLRVARFAAEFAHLGFTIHSDTLHLMSQISQSGELMALSPERIWKETEKALPGSSPQIYFQVLMHCSAISTLFPEIEPLCSPLNSPLSYGLSTLAIASRLSDQKEVRFAALCHVLGKSLTESDVSTDDGAVLKEGRLYEMKKMEQLCERLKLPRRFSELARQALQYRGLIGIIKTVPAPVLLHFFDALDLWRKPYRLEQLILVSEADESAKKGVIKKKPSSQADYIREAFKIARAVLVKDIIDDGFKKTAIKKELQHRRQQVLDQWMRIRAHS